MSFTLKDAVEMYASVADEPFTLETIMTALQKLFPCGEERVPEIAALLGREPSLFHDAAHDVYIPRASFFRGARFMIIPTEYELERAILITGDRLIPFCSPDIFPGKAALYAPDGRRIRRRRINASIAEITEFLSLYGYTGLFNYLETDFPDNAVALAGLNSIPPDSIKVQLAVYVMQDVYTDMGFQPGDGLVFTVQDWREGSFSIARVEAPLEDSATLTRRGQWSIHMEDGLQQAMAMKVSPIEEQIAHAFFLGGRFLVENPVHYVQGFLRGSDHFSLVEEGSSVKVVNRQTELAYWGA
jgi:hypothetical protein